MYVKKKNTTQTVDKKKPQKKPNKAAAEKKNTFWNLITLSRQNNDFWQEKNLFSYKNLLKAM